MKHMAHPKPKRLRKSALVNVRMTTALKRDIERQARRDGLNVSDWIREQLVVEIERCETARESGAA